MDCGVTLKKGDLTIMFDWIVEFVDEHTCAGGTPESSGIHEQTCGFIPIQQVDRELGEIRAGVAKELGDLFQHRKPNGQAYNGYHVAREMYARAETYRVKEP